MNIFKKTWTRYRAAKKVVRLYSEDLSPKTEKDLANWRLESKEFQQNFVDILDGLAGVQGLKDEAEILEIIREYEDIQNANQIAIPKQRFFQWPKMAAALACLLVIGFLFKWNGVSHKDDWSGYVTRVGEQKTITLSDGSSITLNTATELLVNINDKSRNLILKRGEAYFDVAKDPMRPFSVEVGDRSVTALGTAFNIRKSPEKITVTVLEGVVSLHKNELEVISSSPLLKLTKGKEVTINSPEQNRIDAGKIAELDLSKNKLRSYAPTHIEQNQEWRRGQLRFEQVPLKDVILELNRYTTKKILIQDASIMEIKVYAIILIDKIDLALTSLEKTLPIKVARYFDHIVLTAKN